jgi:hypothetical protein
VYETSFQLIGTCLAPVLTRIVENVMGPLKGPEKLTEKTNQEEQ